MGEPAAAVVIRIARRGLAHRQLVDDAVAVDEDEQLVEGLDVMSVWRWQHGQSLGAPDLAVGVDGGSEVGRCRHGGPCKGEQERRHKCYVQCLFHCFLLAVLNNILVFFGFGRPQGAPIS